MGSGAKSQVVGFIYYLGIHMGISRGPVDELIEIKVGDKPTWRGSIKENSTIVIDQPNIFGGQEKEGGIQGNFTALFGGPTQTPPSFMGSVLKVPMPGFRRMFTVFFDGIVSMNSAYPKPWKFRVRRALGGWDGPTWYPERAVISMVRPISEAELQENFNSVAETNELNAYDQVFVPYPYDSNPFDSVSPPLPPFTYTLQIPDGGTFLYFGDSYAGYGNETIPIFEGPGQAFTRAGNVITIDPQYYGRYLTINYVYSHTAIPPNLEGLGTYGEALIQAMNPAHILYECYTNREWGRGLPRERLDDPAWRAVADQLAGEGFGMCIRWNRSDEIRNFIQLVANHVGMSIYSDLDTGKLTPKLIRDDYTRENVPLFDSDSGLMEINDSPIAAQGPLVNEIQVKYHDPVTDSDRTVRANNLANLQSSGGEINTVTRDYPGIPTAALASRLAKRDLRSVSTNLRTFDLTLDRRGSKLIPGGLMRIRDYSRNIPDIVLRIGTIDYGTLRDGKIKIKAAQDVFGLPIRGFPTQPPPQYTPPSLRPCVGPVKAFELPYFAVRAALTNAEFAAVDDASAYFGVALGQGQPLNTGFSLGIKPGAVSGDEIPADGSYYCGYTP